MEAKTGQAQEDGASREEQASKVTWRLFTWFSIINAMFVTAAKRLRLRWKNTWWLFTWFSIRNAMFVTTAKRLRLRWKNTWGLFTWFSIRNSMFVTTAQSLWLRWKDTWWLFTWFISIRNAMFVTTSQRLRLRWKDTWWSITWFYSWHPFLLKPQSMVLDPSKKKCIRLLDGNILGDSKTLIHRVDSGSIKSQFLNSCIQKRLYWCVGQLFYCKN